MFGAKNNAAPGAGPKKSGYDQDEFYTLSTDIVPFVAESIDKKGGFCSIGEVANEDKIKELLATLPPPMPRKLKAVIDLFPEFVTCFEGGRVATAKGYELGLVNADGTVNAEAVKKQKEEQKKASAALKTQTPAAPTKPGQQAGAGATPAPAAAGTGPAPPSNHKKHLVKQLADIARKMDETIMTASEKDFNILVKRSSAQTDKLMSLIGAPKQTTSSFAPAAKSAITPPGAKINPTAAATTAAPAKGGGALTTPEKTAFIAGEKTRTEILKMICAAMKEIEEKGKGPTVANLSSKPEIAAVKGQISGGKIVKLIEECPDLFTTVRQEGNPEIKVSLKPGHVANVLGFGTQQKGKGKGGGKPSTGTQVANTTTVSKPAFAFTGGKGARPGKGKNPAPAGLVNSAAKRPRVA